MANKRIKKPVHAHIPVAITGAQRQEEKYSGFSMNLKFALLLGLISCIVYANTLNNGYTLDDCAAIRDNAFVKKGITSIPKLLFTPYHRGSFATSNDLYRPLSLVMFAVEYQLFGYNPAPGHFFNILLFVCSVILLFLFLDQLFERKKTAVAFLASLLFAVHPIHTEVVANIKSRDELLCFFFAFLSLNIFLKYINTGKLTQLLAGAFCFFLSLMSKESVITFLAVIPLIFLFYRNENIGKSIYVILWTALVAIIFLTIRYFVLNFYHANEITNIPMIDNALSNPNIPYDSRIATAILILGYYVKLIFIPYPLICDYAYNTIPYSSFSNPAVLISLAVYIFLAVFSIRFFLKNHKNPFAFGIFFFLITISLFSNIPFLIGTTMGERLLFFPSVGFCVTIAFLMEKVAGGMNETNRSILTNKTVLGILIPVAIIFFVMTIHRNSEWVDNYTLYSSDIKNAPQSGKLNFWLGLELLTIKAKEEKDPSKLKQIKEAGLNYIYKSVAIYPDFEIAQSELCAAYFRNGQYDSAEIHGEKAISLNPTSVITLNNLASVYYNKKKYDRAMAMYKNAIKLLPDFVDPYTNVATCYLNLGKLDSGIYYLNKAISVDPTFNRSYEYLAMAYKTAGKLDSAKKYEAIAQKNKK